MSEFIMLAQEKALKDEIINTGKKISGLRLVTGRAGNLSIRLDEQNILITATATSLGDLKDDEIVKVNLVSDLKTQDKRLSTEFPLHSLIYKNFPVQAIIHCHPALINGYFAVCPDLKVLTFETKLYLGKVPVVEQETPSITQPQLVIDALKTNNLVVIKNHGVVSVGSNFKEALYLIETLEEAVKVAAVARLFKQGALDDLDQELKESLAEEDCAYPMFSQEHVRKIVDLVNHDEFIAKKGQELDLTLQLAIKLEGSDSVYKFNFEKGKITKLEFDEKASFMISAHPEVWRLIFLGGLDPFVATTQGKMKLKGDLGRLSRWYVPFSRLFELFKQVKIQ